ncbi:MAG: DUF2961 domain-containing protein [Clostridia bacterium]|nr:DUF2961 domain-containing protein [Clostridia bacterium]
MYFPDPTRFYKGRTFAASSENLTAEKGGGSRGSAIEKCNPYTVARPGETLTLLDIDGPGTVQHIWLGGVTGWNMILRIYWDNQENPSVEAPVSAFFGYPYYENVRNVDGAFPTLNSALISVMPCRGFSCFFKMPFKKHCRITLENRSEKQERMIYYTITGVLGEVPEDTLYFHASYRQALPHKAGDAYVFVDGIEGKGNFIGVTLGAGLNGTNGCWVEGEIKMYIDGDEYPSINYTGTEDYFCGSYAFGYDMIKKYQPYTGLYSGCFAIMGGEIADRSVSDYNVQPRFMAYRWHVPDPIVFEKDFKMTMLNMGFRPDGINYGRRDDLVSVAYWYQNLTDKPLAPLPSDREIALF